MFCIVSKEYEKAGNVRWNFVIARFSVGFSWVLPKRVFRCPAGSDLGICVSKGCIRGRVYTEKNGWLPYITFRSEYDIADTENGVLGDGSPIQAVQLYYITPNGYAYKKAVYCVSDMNHEIFYPIQNDDEMDAVQDGYAGIKGVAVDKFQAWVE